MRGLYVRLDERFFISVLVLAPNVRLEVIEARPPLSGGAIAWVRTCRTNVADLVADAWGSPVNGLPVALQIVLSREALCPSASILSTSKRFRMLQVVFPTLVSICISRWYALGLTVHRTDSSTLCRKSDKAERTTSMTWSPYVEVRV